MSSTSYFVPGLFYFFFESQSYAQSGSNFIFKIILQICNIQLSLLKQHIVSAGKAKEFYETCYRYNHSLKSLALKIPLFRLLLHYSLQYH